METRLIKLVIVILMFVLFIVVPSISKKIKNYKLNQLKTNFVIDSSLSQDEKLKMAKDFIEKEDYDKAILLCDNIIKQDKNCAMAYCLKAQALFYGPPETELAVKLVTKAIELDPNIALAYLIRANAGSWCYNGIDEKLQMEDYNKAIELDPNFSEAYLNRGRLKTDNGDIEGAIEDFNSAIETNPNNDEAYYERGNIKNDRKDFYGAIADYEKALLINPKDSFAKTKRTLCLFRTGQTLKGILSIFGK